LVRRLHVDFAKVAAVGTSFFEGTLPAAYLPIIVKWRAIFGAVNSTILTAARRRGYLDSKAAASIVPDASTVVKILLVTFALSMLLADGSARAQALKKPQFTGDFAADAGANLGGSGGASSVLTGNPSKDMMALYQKLQNVSKADLQYALNIANKKSNVAAA
jgi:hypothetical protein